jgi:hypothetical protein
MKIKVDDLIFQTKQLKTALKIMIRGLPNYLKDMEPLGPNCGVISSSIIEKNGGNLSPDFYIMHKAKTELCKLIDSSSIETLETKFTEVIETGRLPGSGIKVNQEFRDDLKLLWNK